MVNKKRIILTIIVLITIGIFYFYFNKAKVFKVELNTGETILTNLNISNLSYLSRNTDIATVDSNGIIYSISEGTAEIEVKNSKGKIVAVYKVNVKKNDDLEETILDTIVIDNSFELNAGEVKKLSYSFIPETYTGRLVWISSDENIVLVDSEGNVKGLKEGEAQIEVSTLDLSVSKSILIKINKGKEVITNKEDTLQFNKSSVDIGVGEKYNSILNIDKEIISWTSSNTSVATVNNGVIESKSLGTATITAKASDGSSTSMVIYVQKKDELEKIEIEKKLEMFVGDSFTPTVSVYPSTSSKRNLTWTSSDTNIATVSDGVVSAKAIGNATITVTSSNGKSATCEVIVKEKTKEVVAETITLDKNTSSIKKDETLTLKASLLPDNAINKEVYWSSSNLSVASVSNGVVTGIKEGTAIITATTSNGKKATCLVTVNVVKAETITLNTNSVSLYAGEQSTLKAEILPLNVYDKAVYWSSSDNSIATVSNGVVIGIKEGTATITATTSNSKKVTATIKVTEKKAEFISLNVKTLNLGLNSNYTLVATINPADTYNKTITWSSSNNSIVTVSNGVVTGIKEGTATITANTSNGKSANCNITVSKIPVTSFNIDTNKVILSIGKTRKINVSSILPSNATLKTATYTSLNSNIVSVDSSGNISGVAQGKTKINVKVDDITKTIEVYVLPVGDKVYFLNSSDNSDSIIIESNGQYGMIDAGNIVSVQNYIKYLNITSLDFFLLSHWHYDHYAAVNTILNNYFTPQRFFMKQYNGNNTDDTLANRSAKINLFNSWKNRLGTAYKEVSSNLNFTMGNFTFDLFNTPDRLAAYKDICLNYNDVDKGSTNWCNENANSVIALARVNGKKIYFSGDMMNLKICKTSKCMTAGAVEDVDYIYKKFEYEIAQSVQKYRCGSSSSNCIDIYKVAHHGFNGYNSTQNSNMSETIDLLNPKYAVATTKVSDFSSWSCTGDPWCDPLESLVNRIKSNGQTFNLNYTNQQNRVLVTGNGTVVANITSSGIISFITITWEG